MDPVVIEFVPNERGDAILTVFPDPAVNVMSPVEVNVFVLFW
jgi:hypothetical protein